MVVAFHNDDRVTHVALWRKVIVMSVFPASRPQSGTELAMPRLLLEDGTIIACLRRYDRSRTIIGRSPMADVWLHGDGNVSGEHACITWNEATQAHDIHDCGSATGTLLDGIWVNRPMRLTNGARIRIGLHELVYCNRLPMPGYVGTLTRRIRPSRDR